VAKTLRASSAAGGEIKILNFNNLRNYLFYTQKPYIPRRLQIALRRRIAQYNHYNTPTSGERQSPASAGFHKFFVEKSIQ
jgi:hypothetical protein